MSGEDEDALGEALERALARVKRAAYQGPPAFKKPSPVVSKAARPAETTKLGGGREEDGGGVEGVRISLSDAAIRRITSYASSHDVHLKPQVVVKGLQKVKAPKVSFPPLARLCALNLMLCTVLTSFVVLWVLWHRRGANCAL